MDDGDAFVREGPYKEVGKVGTGSNDPTMNEFESGQGGRTLERIMASTKKIEEMAGEP